jgi:thymidine phosphorylase
LAGIYLLKKIDELVNKNDALSIFYAKDKYRLKEAVETFKNLPIFKIE